MVSPPEVTLDLLPVLGSLLQVKDLLYVTILEQNKTHYDHLIELAGHKGNYPMPLRVLPVGK